MAKELQEEISKFSKSQFIEGKVFPEMDDVLSVVLENEKLYTVEQAKKLVEQFLKVRI